jgi:D-glycero-alpha-D-manno-heptose-7-phosphate kinase
MAIKSVSCHAPTRVDLAGGTLDLWPIYLFLEQPTTINMGISLFAKTHLQENPAKGQGDVLFLSDDQKIKFKVSIKDIIKKKPDEAKVPHQVGLHYRLLRYFLTRMETVRQVDLELSTHAMSPAGAGLGGSSALSVSLLAAIKTWAEGQMFNPSAEGDLLIDIVRDIETDVIQVPAGLQDYYGAMYGGLQAMKWNVARHNRESFGSSILDELRDRIVLFYSGQSRNSGINNWVLFKKFIDQDKSVQKKFHKINDSTLMLEKAIKAKNWEEIGFAIHDEWQVRKTLAKGISTKTMDEAFAHAMKKHKAVGKVCGAGGGGCFFLYFPTSDPQKRKIEKEGLISVLEKKGIRHLPFNAVEKGIDVQVRHA